MIATARFRHGLRHPVGSVRAAARRVRSMVPRPGAVPCLVCGSRRTRVTNVQRKRRAYDIRSCDRCGHLSNFANTVDYTAFDSVESFKLSARVGTAQHQGREFHMGQMGVEILGRPDLEVMVFGAGRSLDYQHLAALPTVRRVVMSDVVELTGEADFVNILEGTDERFDLIIACEVVEHFEDPVAEFSRLLDLLTPSGLLVCSTNVYDGGNFARHNYLYLRGHVSYYSERAIAHIARLNGMQVDLRTPFIALGSAGPRKRYLLFSRSPEVARRSAAYAERHPYAPSEDVAAFDALHEVQEGITGDAARVVSATD